MFYLLFYYILQLFTTTRQHTGNVGLKTLNDATRLSGPSMFYSLFIFFSQTTCAGTRRRRLMATTIITRGRRRCCLSTLELRVSFLFKKNFTNVCTFRLRVRYGNDHGHDGRSPPLASHHKNASILHHRSIQLSHDDGS